MINLRGMTWDHSRGFDPMVATANEYQKINPEVEITWEKRSLQAFADRPIEEMATTYDLMVIDHPHVGEVAKNGLLLALDNIGRDDELAKLANESVGESHPSYQFANRQWALAIDAATPVACYRPDLIEDIPRKWNEVIDLAKDHNVAFALIPINALMTFMGFLRNQDLAIANGDLLVDKDAATTVLEMMCEVVSLMDVRCLELDPIGIYDWLGNTKEAPAYSPFGYGYTNYSRNNYCQYPLQFTDAPGVNNDSPQGSVLGGTGIAISSKSKHTEIAVDYAFWIASSECQSGLYFHSGGQPSNTVAWEDENINTYCRNFFTETRRTLDTAWVRPRYDGYMKFQDEGGDLIHACLRKEATIDETVIKLQNAYIKSKKLNHD